MMRQAGDDKTGDASYGRASASAKTERRGGDAMKWGLGNVSQ